MNGNKAMKKRSRRAFPRLIASLLFLLAGLLTLASCAKAIAGPEYDYDYDPPFTPVTDADMTVDGKLDEEAWKDQNVMTHTSDDVTIEATTVFTEKGLYVGLTALDANIQWYLRNNFEDNSNFRIRIAKDGEPNYDIGNPGLVHPMRYADFNIDAKTSRSYLEMPYAAKSYVDGELNSAQTKSMTAELFVTWEDLHYTQEELGEQGYPDTVGLFISYRKVIGEESPDNIDIIPSFIEDYRYQTYLKFGADGLKNIYSSEVLGNADNGPSASDQWTIDDASGTAESDLDRTQVLWFKEGYAQNFMLEATIDLHDLGAGSYPTPGLISYGSADAYKIFAFNGAVFKNEKKLQLECGNRTDGMQILDKQSRDPEVVEEDYEEGTVKLRMIKWGTRYYYFYNGNYWCSEEMSAHTGGAFAGLFTNGAATFSEYKFENYDGREQELQALLSESMYLINVPGVMARGTIQADKLSVRKGDPVTITFSSGSAGYMLTEIYDGEEDIYETVVQNMVDGKYTFTPEKDVNITAVYSAFPSDARVSVLMPLRGAEQGAGAVSGATYTVYDSGSPLLRFSGSVNSQGNIVVTIPKAGEYEVGGRTVTVNGEYTVTVSAPGYHDATATFTLNDETTSTDLDGQPESVAEDKSYTHPISVEQHAYGQVTVNGELVQPEGTLEYDETADNYYTYSTYMGVYYRKMVGGEYKLNAVLSYTEMGAGKDCPVAGIVLHSGSNVIVLKGRTYENTLYIAVGESIGSTIEVGVNGFPAIGKAEEDGQLIINVVRFDNVIYLYDNENVLKAYLDGDGIHLLNGASFGGALPGDFNNRVKDFFNDGDENVIGAVRYGGTGVRTAWTMNYTAEGVEESISGGDFTFETETEDYLAQVDGLVVGNGFVKDSLVTLTLEAMDPEKVIRTLKLTDTQGDVTTINGVYDPANSVTVFTFTFDKAYKAEVGEIGTFAHINGTVGGAAQGGGTLLILGETGLRYETTVSEKAFEARLPADTYTFIYTESGVTAYLPDQAIAEGEGASIALNAAANKNTTLGTSATVNGRVLDSAYGSREIVSDPVGTAQSAVNSSFTLENDTNNSYFMPGTVTAEDYSFTVTIENVGNMAGIFVTDGANILGLQVQKNVGYKHLIVTFGSVTGWGEPWTALQLDGKVNEAKSTVTIARAGNSFEIYLDTYDGADGASNKVLAARILADGTLTLGNGVRISEEAKDGAAAAKPSLANLLAANEHVAGLWRNNGNAQSVTYTPVFTEYEVYTLNGSVAFNEGTAQADVSFVSEETGITYTLSGIGGAFTASLPYGTYTYTVTAEGYYAQSGTVEFTTDGQQMTAVTLELIPVYTVTVSLAEGLEGTLTVFGDAEKTFPVKNGDTLELPKGTYGFIFENATHTAYVAEAALEGDTTITLNAVENKNTMLGSSATVNGVTLDAAYGGNAIELDQIDKVNSAMNASFTLANNTTNSYFMPGTATANEYEYTVTMEDMQVISGIFVTDGVNAFGAMVQPTDNSKSVYVFGGSVNAWGEPWTQYTFTQGERNNEKSTLIIRRVNGVIEVYLDTYDGAEGASNLVHLGTLQKDGSFVPANGVKEGISSTPGGGATQTIANAQEQLKALVAANEHIAGLWRNDGSAQSVTYTPVFTEYEVYTLNGSVAFDEGEARATVSFVSKETGFEYTLSGISGTFTASLPYGTYTYTVTAEGYYSQSGELEFTTDGQQMTAVTLEFIVVHTVTIKLEEGLVGTLTVFGDAEKTLPVKNGDKLDLSEGSYGFIFENATHTAYVAEAEITADTELTLNAVENKNTMLGASATVNDVTLDAAYAGVEGRKIELKQIDKVNSAMNASFTLENDTNNSYFMPNTVTEKDYEYSVTMEDMQYISGIFVTDGVSAFGAMLQPSDGSKSVYVFGSDVNGYGEPWEQFTCSEGTANYTKATLTIRRANGVVEIYLNSYDGLGNVLIGTLNGDGSFTLANGVSKGTEEAKGGLVTMKEQLKALVAANEHVAGLWRNDNRTQSVTYTPVFTELTFAELTGTATFDGEAATDARIEFVSESGIRTSAAIENGAFTADLAYGTYTYTATAAGYVTLMGSFDFNAQSSPLALSFESANVENAEFGVVKETETSIIFTWEGVNGAQSYEIVRQSDNAVIADYNSYDEDGGMYTFTLDKTQEGYEKDATYVLKVIPEEGKIVDEAQFDTFKASEFAWHLLAQYFNNEALADSVSITGAGATVEWVKDVGLRVTGSGTEATTVHFLSYRTTQTANYLGIALFGSGEATVAGTKVTLTEAGIYVPIAQDVFNAGFDITFTGTLSIREITVDAFNSAMKGAWDGSGAGFGVVNGESNNAYTITEGNGSLGTDPGQNNDQGIPHGTFMPFLMPNSVNFTIEAKVSATAREYAAGFSITSPVNGTANGAIVLDTRNKMLHIASWDGWTTSSERCNTHITIVPGSANWMMSNDDWNAVDPQNCTMALVRSDNLIYFILNGKLLAYFDANVTPIFRTNSQTTWRYEVGSIEGASLSVGFSVIGFVGTEDAGKAQKDSVTFSDWTVKLTPEYGTLLSTVTVQIDGEHEQTGWLSFVGEGRQYDFAIATDGSAVVAVPVGNYTVYYGDQKYVGKTEDFAANAGNTQVTVTAAAGRNTMLGSQVTVNGSTLTSAYATFGIRVDAVDRYNSAMGESFTLENDTTPAYFLPNTITSGDYEYSVTMENITGLTGIFVTDGTNALGVMLQPGGKSVALFGGGVQSWGEPWTFYNFAEGNINNEKTTLSIKHTNGTFEVYIDTYDGEGGASNKVLVGTLNSDGSLTLADGVTSGDSASGGFAASQTQIASLLASGEHVAGFWRNGTGAQNVTYTPTFTAIESSEPQE